MYPSAGIWASSSHFDPMLPPGASSSSHSMAFTSLRSIMRKMAMAQKGFNQKIGSLSSENDQHYDFMSPSLPRF